MTTSPGRSPMFGRPASRPYAGGTGSTGSAASHERREHEDESGISAYRQEQVLDALREAGTTGLTWSELGDRMAWHHGQSTGALSTLHKDGAIEALTDRRKRSTIYVLKEFVAGRPTREPGQTRGNRELADANEALTRENGALEQQVRDVKAQWRQDLEALAEREGVIAQHEAKIGELSAALRQAEQQLALAVEQMARVDDERARHEHATTEARRQASALADQVASLERTNHAMRVRHALMQMDDEQAALHGRIGTMLAGESVSAQPDTQVIRVTLGVLRTLWMVSGQLLPEPMPARHPLVNPPLEAAEPAAPGPDADPAQ